MIDVGLPRTADVEFKEAPLKFDSRWIFSVSPNPFFAVVEDLNVVDLDPLKLLVMDKSFRS